MVVKLCEFSIFVKFWKNNSRKMKAIDKRTQMMDAGMVLFEDNESFGNAIGRVRVLMERNGKVMGRQDIDAETLPESTGEFDLFQDWSSAWRTRYISCHVESAGEKDVNGVKTGIYAASFKEGSRNTRLRGVTMAFILVILLAAIFAVGNFLVTVLCIALMGVTAYLWIRPSEKSIRNVFRITSELEGR